MAKVPIPATTTKIILDEGKKWRFCKQSKKQQSPNLPVPQPSNTFTTGDVGFLMSVFPTIENDLMSTSVFEWHGLSWA